MLVNCPKCGFSQPKDRYCAKCGVDMDEFRPAQPSFLKVFLSHPLFRTAVMAVLVVAGVLYIRKSRQQDHFMSQVEKIPSGISLTPKSNAQIEGTPPETAPPTEELASQTATPSQIPPQIPPQLASPPPPLPPPPPPPPLPSAPSLPQSANKVEPVSASNEASSNIENNNAGLKVRVIFAEVDDLTLKKWIPEMQAAGSYSEGDWKMGLLPNIEKKMAEDRSIIQLETLQKKLDSTHTTADWFSGKTLESSEASSHLGLRTIVSVQDIDSVPLKTELRVTRLLPNGIDSKQIETKQIDSEVELQAKAGWVLWRILNPKMNAPVDLMNDTRSFFQIYKSARFKSGRSDFTIMLVFDTPSH